MNVWLFLQRPTLADNIVQEIQINILKNQQNYVDKNTKITTKYL